MSDRDSPRGRDKHGTVPGFGPPSEKLRPLEIQPMVIDEAAVLEDAPRSDAHRTPEELGALIPPVNAEVVSAEIKIKGDAKKKEFTPPRSKGAPAVDIDLIYEKRSAPLPDQPWIFLEVWTRNTIYQLDATFLCIDVIDQGSRRSINNHALRGSRLVGGQSRDGESMELSHPFPRPGSEAVFEQVAGKHVRFSQTSPVTRVVMRLRVLTVEPEQLLPTWEDVSGIWDASGKKKKR